MIMGPSVGRRHKSTVRGAQIAPLEYIPGQNQMQGGLKRNNSKPQLQLPEIGGLRQDGGANNERGDSRSQRLVSARANKHN